jgi:putative endonuclease
MPFGAASKETAGVYYNLPVHFVYIVRCSDGSLYTGYTCDPHKRVKVHNSGRGAKYTARRLPVALVYTEPCESLSAALKREHELKSRTRAQKEALLGGSKTIRSAGGEGARGKGQRARGKG